MPRSTDPSAADLLRLDDEFSDSERGTRDRVRAFVDARIRPNIADWYERAVFPTGLVPEMAELGLLGMHLEGYGCAGRSAVEYGLAMRELEAGDSGIRTFVSVQGSLAMTAIHRWGSDAQKQQWLPRMAAGDAIGCFGLTEPGAGSDPASMTTRAVRGGDHWVLTGAKRWIGLASIADVAIIWAKVADADMPGADAHPSSEAWSGGTVRAGDPTRADVADARRERVRGFIVPTGTPGFAATPIEPKLSMRASIQCDIALDDVRLPLDAVLPAASGLRAPFTCLNEARYGIVWGALGAARDSFLAALAHAQGREQFGRPIAGYQLTQDKLVRMALEITKGQLLALQIGRRKDAGTLEHHMISAGKLNNCRIALDVAREARTILGGNGVTLDHSPLRHASNLESVRTYEGTDEVHTLILGERITGFAAYS